MGHPAFLKFPPNINYPLFTGAYSRETLVHPTRVIQFLVGVRGKNETMAIGGPWSPSLDGADPEVSLAFDSIQVDRVARWQNLIPSFPWIAPGWRAGPGSAIQGMERIQFCSVVKP